MILVEGSDALRTRLSRERASSYEVIELDIPNDGLVMVEMREPARKTRFYLGEVLVTEAKAQVAGTAGLGIIAGDRPDDARKLAIIDAAFNAGLSETATWIDALEKEGLRLEREKQARATRLLETRVSFETMDTD